MTTGQIREAEVERDRAVRQAGRVIATLIGATLLIIGAFLDWIPGRAAETLTDKALVQADFGVQDDFVKAVGGLCVLIGLVALIGLADRTGRLTRLAGAAALVLFVMFAIQAYRFYGDAFGTAAGRLGAGAWLVLAGAVVLLVGGFLGARVIKVIWVPTVLVTGGEDRTHADRHD